jgi:protoporphyrinogen oxidase
MLEGDGEAVGTAVLGAGPAGLTAAYVLARRRAPGVVFEADGMVGGIAKTVTYDGYRFDLGGHRFFTKVPVVEQLWREMLGDELLERPRLSRIYYDGKYLAYPLEAKDVTLSYFRSRLVRRRGRETTFEDWVEARFGRRLYDAFFGPYTEKVWGIPGSEIRAEWAAQRIRNFSFAKAVLSILRVRHEHVTTLIERFHYPRLGPGQMWAEFERRAREGGVPVRLRHRVEAVRHQAGHVTEIVVSHDGGETVVPVDAVLSSIPLSELVLSLDPPPPGEVLDAARRLRYRELCLVALMIQGEQPFPDNWIYLHDPGTRAGRVQNFGAWSPDMVKPGTTCLGLEYFCFEGDEIWELPDADAVRLATEELARIGLVDPGRVVDGVKVRVPRAYPMYDGDYHDAVLLLKGFLAGFDNLKTFGRNGLHRYNNQDHSMWTAMLATLNLLDGTDHDVWSVNVEDAYLEDAGEVLDTVVDVDLDRSLPVPAGRSGAAESAVRTDP